MAMVLYSSLMLDSRRRLFSPENSNREMLHSKRVSEICEDIATKMNFGREMMSIRSE